MPRHAVPQLFAGALASRRSDYREGVRDWLRRKLRHGGPAATWAAFTCLPVLADLSMEDALDELDGATFERFGGDPERLREITSRLLTAAESARAALRRTGGLGSWSTAGHFSGRELRTVLAGVGYAMTGFCLASGRIEALDLLTRRIEGTDDPRSLLLVMIFFEPRGVLDTVERFPVHVRHDLATDWSEEPCSRFLASAAIEEATEVLGRFFDVSWRRLAEVPDPFRAALRRHLLTRLRKWATEALPAQVEEALGDLLRHLVESANPDLARRVFDLLQSDPAFSPGSPGEAIAHRALSLDPPVAPTG